MAGGKSPSEILCITFPRPLLLRCDRGSARCRERGKQVGKGLAGHQRSAHGASGCLRQVHSCSGGAGSVPCIHVAAGRPRLFESKLRLSDWKLAFACCCAGRLSCGLHEDGCAHLLGRFRFMEQRV